jgi:hypothetical protein
MNRKQVPANAALLVASVLFVISLMIAVPDQALHMLIQVSAGLAVTLLILWRARIDSRKDERTMQIFTLGMRNGFIFLMFAIPGLVAYIGYGVIVVNALVAFYVLWIAALAIVWISALYYFRAR